MQRPALTKEGVPDPAKRMSIIGWASGATHPRDAAILSFAYPERTSLFHTKTLRLGQRLHQYRLDDIQPGTAASSLPKLVLTDLDTGRKVTLDPVQKARNDKAGLLRLKALAKP